MWNNLSPVIRLMLCLTLSLGLHGGLAYYGRTIVPAEADMVAAPVVVALLPVAETLPKMTKVMQPETPSTVPRPPQSAAVPRTVLPKLSAKKILVEKPLTHDAPLRIQEEPPATEQVCPSPQDIVSTFSAVTKTDETGKEQKKLVTAALTTAANKVVSDLSSPASPALVEAVAKYRSNPLPEYPRLARRKHWEGVVWLLIEVSSAGAVKALHVEESSGHKLLDRAAERTVRRWQFSPATRGGLPVSSQVRIPVRFRLENG